MSVLEKIVKESDFFYKKENLPKFRVGDTIKVTLYLELPKADEAKKGKERIQVYQGVIISTHNNENPTNATITVRKMFAARVCVRAARTYARFSRGVRGEGHERRRPRAARRVRVHGSGGFVGCPKGD